MSRVLVDNINIIRTKPIVVFAYLYHYWFFIIQMWFKLYYIIFNISLKDSINNTYEFKIHRYYLFFITNLIKKNTGGVEKIGAINGAIILFTSNTITKKIIIAILNIYSKI